MNLVTNTISRVGEIVGNVLNHSFSQNAEEEPQMPDITDTEIALLASRPAKNEKNKSRARARAQVPSNVVKQILNGDYEGDPWEIIDGDNDIHDFVEPESPFRRAKNDTVNADTQQQRLRALGQSREDAEAERLLGPQMRMASRWKPHFVSGPHWPINTLDEKATEQGRSKLIRENRHSETKLPTQKPRQRATTPKKSDRSYSNEADGSPPRKKQRTDDDHLSFQGPQQVAIDVDEDELNSRELMEVLDRTRKSPVRSAVKDTALRRMRQTEKHRSAASGLINQSSYFTQNATSQRRQEEARQPTKLFSPSAAPPLRKINATPGVSKMDRRLKGVAKEAESPDVLHEVTSAVGLLSPLAPEEPDYPRFDLRFFFCQGLDADGSDCYVLVCPRVLRICYKNEILSKDALFELRYSKIRMCRVDDDGKEAAIQLSLSGGTLPSNLCYLVFNSPKQSFDFVNAMQQSWVNFKILKTEQGWVHRALHSACASAGDMSSADKAQWERRLQQEHTLHIPDSNEENHGNPQPKRKIRRLDPEDRAPEQVMAKPSRVDPDSPTQTRRNTRSRLSDVKPTNGTLSAEHSGTKVYPQTNMRTRARSLQSVQIDELEPSQPKPEPRVVGDPWERPLTYPPIGLKKQTIEWVDLKRLEDEELLNDSIVGLFLRYIQENANKAYSHQIHTMSTFFYEALMRPTDGKASRKQINYSAVSKWTKSVNIFQRDFVIVPINESLHWYTLLICNLSAFPLKKSPIELDDSEDEDEIEEQPSIAGNAPSEPSKDILKSDLLVKQSDNDRGDPEYEVPKSAKRGSRKKAPRAQRRYDKEKPIIITLDSLDIGGRSSTASMLKDYVIEEGRQKASLEIDKLDIKGMTAKDIPHQGNFYDCGLYVCLYLERLMSNPRKFIDAVLTRDNSTLTWPKRLSSSKMRQRFYEFLQELYRAQEAGESPQVPEVGKILIHDEDYNEPDPKPAPRQKRADSLDREQMQEALCYAETYLHDPSRTSNAGTRLSGHPSAEPEDHGDNGHVGTLINSMQQYVVQENQAVVINDDGDVSSERHNTITSPYFDGSDHTGHIHKPSRFDNPRALASNLQKRRETIRKRDRHMKDVIDLSSPVKHQYVLEDTGREREHRGTSVSTDFLSGEKSYENGSDETVRDETELRPVISKEVPSRYNYTTPMVIDSQPDKIDANPRQPASSLQDEGSRIADNIHSCIRERYGSVVPESNYGDGDDHDDDDDVQLIESRPVDVNRATQRIRSNTANVGHDTEMLLQ